MGTMQENVHHIGFGAVILWTTVAMILSAAVAVAFYDPQWRLKRALFFTLCAFASLITALLDIPFFKLANAVGNTHVNTAFIGLLISAGIYGALIGILSAARSLDAFDTRAKWFFGLIPFVNLYLLFKRSAHAPKAPITTNIGLVFVGILILFAAVAVQKTTSSALIRASVSGSLREQMAEVDKDLFDEVGRDVQKFRLAVELRDLASQEKVPVKLDNFTTLKAVRAEGVTAIYTVELAHPNFKFDKYFVEYDLRRTCGMKEYKPWFDAGVTMKTEYVDTTGRVRAEVTTNNAICAAKNP
jgi:hypothetical protein